MEPSPKFHETRDIVQTVPIGQIAGGFIANDRDAHDARPAVAAGYHWSYRTMQQGVGKGVHPVEVMTRSPDQRWTLRILTSAINARPSNNLGLP